MKAGVAVAVGTNRIPNGRDRRIGGGSEVGANSTPESDLPRYPGSLESQQVGNRSQLQSILCECEVAPPPVEAILPPVNVGTRGRSQEE